MTAHKDLRAWHLDLAFGRAQFNNFSRGGLKHNSIVMVIYELSSALLLLVGYCCCIVADICNISAELAIHLWHPLRPRIRAYVSVSAKDIIQWAATANGLLQLQQMFGASFGEMPFKLGQHLNEVLNDIWEWPRIAHVWGLLAVLSHMRIFYGVKFLIGLPQGDLCGLLF